MRIVKPYAKIMDPELLSGALNRIEYAARISHGSEDQTAGLAVDVAEHEYFIRTGERLSDGGEAIRSAALAKSEKFIRAVVLQHGDWSVVEHVPASVEFLVDRGITHELVRHRIASYTQSSTRFINYAKKMPPTFIYPIPEVECAHCLAGDVVRYSPSRDGDWLHGPIDSNQPCSYMPPWLTAISVAEEGYKALLTNGWRPQEARSVFPNALSSKIMMTCNLRSWRHFFLMRTSKEAHPQMRQVTIPLLAEFQRLVPVLFEDIVPESRQVENIAKGR